MAYPGTRFGRKCPTTFTKMSVLHVAQLFPIVSPQSKMHEGHDFILYTTLVGDH